MNGEIPAMGFPAPTRLCVDGLCCTFMAGVAKLDSAYSVSLPPGKSIPSLGVPLGQYACPNRRPQLIPHASVPPPLRPPFPANPALLIHPLARPLVRLRECILVYGCVNRSRTLNTTFCVGLL